MEKIHYITQSSAGRTVTLTGLTYDAITKDNILGIINETQSEPLYTAMDYGNITNVTYSSGTLTITLANTTPSIAVGDKLLVKLYFDADSSGTEDVEKAVDAARDDVLGLIVKDCKEDIPGAIWDDAYIDIGDDGEFLGEYTTMVVPEDFGVGSIVKAGSIQDGQEDMFYVAKTATSPTIAYDGQDYSVEGVTEWLQVVKGRIYVCTGRAAISYTPEGEDAITGYLYLYAEAKVSLKDIKDAISALSIPTVQQIQAGLALDSTVAKEATLGTTADSSVATTIFGWLKAVWDKLVGIVTTYPYAKEATLTDATNGLAAIKAAASSAATDTAAIETLIGTSAAGQPSTLFAAIAAGGGGGGGGGGDAQESTSQAILAAVKNNDTTALAELLNSTHGLAAIQSLLNGIVNTYPYAKEANATSNKADVISAVNGAMYVNFLANGIQAMVDAEIVVVPDGGQAESVTMDANKLYVFQNRTSDLTISFGTPTANVVNEYHMLLTVGATIPTITMPNTVVWSYDRNPLSALISRNTYEIGILYNSNSVYFAIYHMFNS